MSDNEVGWLFLLFWSAVVTAIVAYIRGFLSERVDCADQAISETPAKWWKDALIDARARREKAETK